MKRAIRVGTCGAVADELRHGDLIVPGETLAEDGAPSRALGAGETVQPDPELTARLAAGTAEDPARIVSTDLFYEGRPAEERPPRARAETWRRRMGLLATAAMHAQP